MPFPVDPRYVRRAAERLGVRLPASYVGRLTRSNGGEVVVGPDVWHLYPVLDDSDRTRLKRTCDDVVRQTAVAHDWPGFPAGAVAIGEDGGGDLLVFLPEDGATGLGSAVYRWDHETGDVVRLADDMDEL